MCPCEIGNAVNVSGACVIARQDSFSPWRCCARRAGEITHPEQLHTTACDWMPATVPGTVAAILAANGRWSFEQPTDFDADDWWFHTTFRAACQAALGREQEPSHLYFDGLATLAEVWLNGELLLTTDNMFRSYGVDVADKLHRDLQRDNELVIGFRSLTGALQQKRPRPRWKTNLVAHQQLRWQRTTLQGRIPGWSPPAPAVGPWRQVRLAAGPLIPQSIHLQPRLEGTTGIVTIDAHFVSTSPLRSASLQVGSNVGALQVQPVGNGFSVNGEVRIPDAKLWWPHTHGKPALSDCELVLEADDTRHQITCSPVGFRLLEIASSTSTIRDANDGAGGVNEAALAMASASPATDRFQVRVNGEAVFCRGACWTVSEILSLTGTAEQLRHDLVLARDAGVNMLRVGGTMVYESDAFYRLCDELGILVWQDFMFANMDYPVEDAAFRANITAEATEQLQRLAAHPCVAVYCGNSEVEQQAAMLGLPRELWRNSWFAEQLPTLCRQLHPGTAYVPSTPSGGVLPFQPSVGLTHYYGVGAYLRPLTDVRRADVKFTPECLGFSNVPEQATIDAITGGTHAVMHDPQWKRRVPRDTGAGWDFEDVRDHYLREIFQVDPVQLRSRDTTRYLQLSRLVSGEMLQQTYSEWRSGHSRNGGALVWFYKDLWPAAGWGIIDSTGTPKAAYYFLKRSWASRQLVLTDEGLNGLQLHLVNETADDCDATVEVMLLKEPNVVVARQELSLCIAGRSLRTLSAEQILGAFYDVSYAYRFGPAHHDVVVATWYDADRRAISEAVHFIQRSVPMIERGVPLQSMAEPTGSGEYRITLQADRLLHAVQLTADGYLPDDNYFHLLPNRPRTVTFRARSEPAPRFKAMIEALNLESSHVVTVPPHA